ncbi:uncharacterized protein YndB with AHSA1/START domain [Sphingopyxis sp. OAS728]|uniref:SRPBCC family protein n=1 Tax=Sphingopyxis sp. OAS728 TaxID=2663823 RepID=UPI00178A5E81|nr:SRPBCC domain-containing protein [Sphingopyxis sp. OAS728]MBE1527956.1 uncharacterized protein YndB with AHSA1/START domain [Sphingopyxis sp. OAS728]
MSSLTIEKEFLLPAPRERIFACLTEPVRIVRIFPFEHVEIEPQVGGLIRFDGTADGRPFCDSGTIECFEAPTLFQYRYWSDNHDTVRSPDTEVVLRYELADAEGATRLTVRHSQLPSEAYAAMMDAAWDQLLAGFALALGDPRL